MFTHVSLIQIISILCLVIYSNVSYSNVGSICENIGNDIVIEINSSIRFLDDNYNNPEFLSNLDSRITRYHHKKPYVDGGQFNRNSYSVNGEYDNPTKSFGTTHCISLDDFGADINKDSKNPPYNFTFEYGPRTIRVKLPEVAKLYEKIVKRGPVQESEKTGNENVVVLKNILDLVISDQPNWIVPELVDLAVLSDGARALRVKIHNPTNRQIRGTELALYATNAGTSRCVSGSQPIQASIELEQSNNTLSALATNLEFGDIQRMPVNLRIGGCGELDLNMQLGLVPTIKSGDELLVNYKFGEFKNPRSGHLSPFWSEFDEGGAVKFIGDYVWPKRLSFYVK